MERLDSIGLNSALIQDTAPPQDHGNAAINRKPVDFGKPVASGGGGPIWARGPTDRDPLFPEPDLGPSKPFNGAPTRWGGNEPKKWAGVRPEPERRPAPVAAGLPGAARRWDETRPQGRGANWMNEGKEPDNWRGARNPARANDIPWRKNDVRREGNGALPPSTSFAATHGLVPGPRAGVTAARPPAGGRAPAIGTKYNKNELMNVLYKMKNESGDPLPAPDDVPETDEFRDIWRPSPVQQQRTQSDQACLPPPGLDPNHMIKTQLEQATKHFAGLGIRSPLQALHLDQYFYKDPAGTVQGPFPSENLKSWNDQGYLYDDLQCQSGAAEGHFFPFSALKSLWGIGGQLNLGPGDLERLADAEAQFADPLTDALAAPPPAMPTMPLPDVAAPPTLDMHLAHEMPRDAQPMQASRADVHRWIQGVPEPVLAGDDHLGVGSMPLHAEKHDPNYDPIDDIIDEPVVGGTAVDPRDGGRVLQPFGGMGPVGPEPSAGPLTTHAAQTQQVPATLPVQRPPLPQQQQEPALMIAPDTILNIPVQVGRGLVPEVQLTAPAAAAQAQKLATHAAGGAAQMSQYISPYDLFTPTQPEPQHAEHDMPGRGRDAVEPALAAYDVGGREAQRAMRAAALANARGWGAPAAAAPTGVPLADIQREELSRRQQEEAAAQVAAQAHAAQAHQERGRRAAWTAQPQAVNFRQIVEEEECAAELEGGYDGGKDDYSVPDYNPWQAQAALPQDTHDAHATAAADGNDMFWETPAPAAARPSAANAPRTAAQVLGKDQARTQAQAARRTNAAAAAPGRAAWQATPARPAATEKVPAAAAPAQSQTAITGDMDPEIFKNSPEFREWCIQEMQRLQGNETVLMVLLETGANCDIMEIANSNLKGDNIGAFVAEFIKRKAQATKAPGRRKRRGGAAATAAAAPAPVAAPSAARATVTGNAGVGDGFVAVGGKGKGGKKKGAQPAGGTQNIARIGGNAFAMLPSM